MKNRMVPSKATKIVLGCCLALVLARSFELDHSTSVVTITLLSVQNTRRDTLQVAARRLCAFGASLLISSVIFRWMGHTIPALGLFLLVFTLTCQQFGLLDGLSMSTVLTLHFWAAPTLTTRAVFNELALMLLGIAMGVLMNAYMPRLIREIREDQRRIDGAMGRLLEEIARLVLLEGDRDQAEEQLGKLGSALEQSIARVSQQMNNVIFQDRSYYLSYIELRRKQQRMLRRMLENTARLKSAPRQSDDVAEFLKLIAWSLSSYDNAGELLFQLYLLRTHFRSLDLPETREEFEARAVLFELVGDVEQLLLVKQEFAQSLTPEQIRLFWEESSRNSV